MFTDQPVGAGYSYADTDDDFTRDNQEIAEDLVTLLKVFLENYPDFQVATFRLHHSYHLLV